MALLRREMKRLKHRSGSFAPLSLAEALETFKGTKRKLYDNAYQRLLVNPLTYRNAKIKAFVKAEKADPLDKVNPDPRIIQARDPEYNLEMARYLRKIEHLVYGWKYDGVPCVAKCLNPTQRASLLAQKWRMFDNPVCVSLDCSRFDLHVTRPLLDLEHEFYQSCFPDDVWFKYLLSCQKVNRGRTLNGVKYVVNGGRMSGDMNTAVGNCLLMMLMATAAMKELKIGRYQVLDDGDDCLLLTERTELETLMSRLPGVFSEFGMELKIENVAFQPQDVIFCQSKITWNGEKWVFCRPWRKILSQACCGTKHWHDPKEVEAMFGAVGDCELATGLGIPIIQPFAQRLRELSNGKRAKFVCLDSSYQYRIGSESYATLNKLQPRPITDEARAEFHRTWGVPPWEQLAIEYHISKWQPEFRLIDYPSEMRGSCWVQNLHPNIPQPTCY
jgi:hypothetical protein